MKRLNFLAVTGAAAVAAGFAVPAVSVAKTVQLPVLETDWMMSQTSPLWFKRYFVKNPPGAVPGKPYLAYAMTMTFDEWHSPHRAEIQKTLDDLAKVEMREWIMDGTTYPNVVLFGGDDCLPVCSHPYRPR